jgi:hypothetical protein
MGDHRMLFEVDRCRCRLILILHVLGTYGTSMIPTMAASGTFVLMDRLHRRSKDLQIGDVVSFAPRRARCKGYKTYCGHAWGLCLQGYTGTGKGRYDDGTGWTYISRGR